MVISRRKLRTVRFSFFPGEPLVYVFFVLMMLAAQVTLAQEEEKEIDASKPTNFYTQLSNSLEWSKNVNDVNLYGYRANISIASADQHHLIFGEVPLLYNDITKKFGFSDIRLRYFGLTHKDYSKQFGGVWGGSVDIFFPTGNFEDGLGTSSWIIAPGIVTGLIFSKSFQSFPIVSYQYISKPTTDLLADSLKTTRHGMTFQAITVLNFGNWFLWVTPIYVIPDLSDSSQKNRFIIELTPSINPIGSIRPAAFLRYDFQNKSYQARLSLVVYL